MSLPAAHVAALIDEDPFAAEDIAAQVRRAEEPERDEERAGSEPDDTCDTPESYERYKAYCEKRDLMLCLYPFRLPKTGDER